MAGWSGSAPTPAFWPIEKIAGIRPIGEISPIDRSAARPHLKPNDRRREMALLPSIVPAPINGLVDGSAGPEEARGTAIDEAAIAAITELHREIFPAGGAILDLMSGWVSHLPPEVPYGRVVGIGAHACVLAD